jgi:predicted CXXCH cytochrome family protein
LKQRPEKICQECHSTGKSLVLAHLGFPLKHSNCLTCHSAHVSKNKGLLKPVVHEPFARGDCQSCHSEGINLKGDLTSLCTRCHKQIKKTFLKIQSHLVTGKESCNSCHTPHASDDRGLLIRAKEKLCFSCHWDTRDRMAATKGNKPHPLAGKGCFECHAGHGSNQPFLLRTDGVQVCTGCHKTQGKFTHPVGEGIKDPRNQLPVDCTTCHDTKYSKYAAYLRLPEERLCLQCHYRGK